MPASKSQKESLAVEKAIEDAANALADVTHFCPEESRQLIKMFNRLTDKYGKLDRVRFREFLFRTFMLTDDIMLDLTFRAFDRNEDGMVDLEEFVNGMSICLRGNDEQIIQFCWAVYDMNGDGSLAREELSQCLAGCFIPGFLPDDEIEDAERDIVEIVMRKLDCNRDGLITIDDFQLAAHRDPILAEAVGQCLPGPKAMTAICALLNEDFRTYTEYLSLPDGKSRVKRAKSAYSIGTEHKSGGHRSTHSGKNTPGRTHSSGTGIKAAGAGARPATA